MRTCGHAPVGRSKYGDLDAAELARRLQLEDENSLMRRIIANQSLEINAMKNVISKTAGALGAERSDQGASRSWRAVATSMFDYQSRRSAMNRSPDFLDHGNVRCTISFVHNKAGRSVG
jgi:hypothetical protein